MFRHFHNTCDSERICRLRRPGEGLGEPFFGLHEEEINYDHILVSVSAHTILQALLDCIDRELEHPQDREEARYADIMWLISSIQKHLDIWSTRNDDRIIGRFAREGVENDSPFQNWKPVWYLPLEEGPSGFTNELMRELFPWTVRAEGFDETWESFAELGILAKVDFEVHDVQGWVDKFQKQRSADGSFADGLCKDITMYIYRVVYD
ncbi:hypothetical protein LA080_014557 [Diaporthe eres]|nr:hypothetical protein LA080_014557 [Diaporthe eres]